MHPAPRHDQRGVRGAANRVIEEFWRDEDNPTYQAAGRLFADGLARHDVIHRLAGTPAPTVGSSVIRGG